MTKVEKKDGTVGTLVRGVKGGQSQASTSADGVTTTRAGQGVTPDHAERSNRSMANLQTR